LGFGYESTGEARELENSGWWGKDYFVKDQKTEKFIQLLRVERGSKNLRKS